MWYRQWNQQRRGGGALCIHFVCAFLGSWINLCSFSGKQRERAIEAEPETDEKGGGREPRSWSAPKLQHEPFSGTSWASCRARGRVCVPPSLPLPPRGENHYQIQRPAPHAERWLLLQQHYWIVFTAQTTRAAQPREETDAARNRFLNAQSLTRSVS